MKKIFKVGDKVAIPTTKSCGCSFRESAILTSAFQSRQNFLFVTSITDKGISCNTVKKSTTVKQSTIGDWFLARDLKFFSSPAKKAKNKPRDLLTIVDCLKERKKLMKRLYLLQIEIIDNEISIRNLRK